MHLSSMRIVALLICAACGAAGPSGPAARTPADSAFATALRGHLETATQAGEFSGAVLVVRDGRTLFEGAYGLTDRERGIPNTPLTQFRVGSMNKMITAVAALQLVQNGTLRLDAPLGTYLPDYPNAEVASKVTLHHLLTHTGGTGDIFGPAFDANRSELRTTADYLELYGTRALQFEPGTRWAYSNYGFMLLGAVIERVAGKSYYDHVAARVLAPAGMTATASAPEDSVVPGRSVGYTRQLVPGELVSNAPTLPYRGTPAGGGYSTVGDFARFADAIRERRLLDPAHTALLLDGKVAVGQGAAQYAYGFSDRVVGGRRFVGHGGGAPGMNGLLEFEPDGGYVVVVLSNFDPPAASRVANFILDRLPATPVAHAQTSVTLPDTPAGTILRAWLDAFNSGDSLRLDAYHRQYDPGRPAEASANAVRIDGATRARVIESALAQLDRSYVFPEIAKQAGDSLRARLRRGAYDPYTSGPGFAARLHNELREITRDKHLSLRYSAPVQPAGPPPSALTADQLHARTVARLEANNCGFAKAEVLPGNIGYLKFNLFTAVSVCGPTASAAMNALADTRALIIDLRENTGGSPGMVAYISSYLFSRKTHLNSLWDRTTGQTTEFWTSDGVPGPKFGGEKPVYVLTSARTFSGAEEFSYNLKSRKRAVIVGETTRGGAHPVRSHRIDDHFTIAVPFARAINPITKTNWEGVGVEPDVKVPASEALATALKLIAEGPRS